ncbi:deaminase, partial [Streptomyces sp. NPDC059909]|uniref:deaminase n=1 Tax=Streptomyces sp. NPDC059909 TaxID=3346998 RepID=UPI003653A118
MTTDRRAHVLCGGGGCAGTDAQLRQRCYVLNMDQVGTSTPKKEGTLARLDYQGQTFYGMNAPGVQHSNPGGVMNMHLLHAEGDALAQAHRAGLRGGVATLHTDRAPCPFCRNNFAGMSRALNL